MFREITHPDLVLMVPLSPEEERKVAYLEETLTDGQWEVRELIHEDAIRTLREGGNQPGAFTVDLDYVVRHLFLALDTVSQAEADAFAAEVAQFNAE